ncbi:similarity to HYPOTHETICAL PROTEIN Y586_METJA [Encephalitozoon cuniculi GB-M1]|uniref:HTH cro/C1-type domain-containing protein n=2 Tax=Encephalitozoon cuniculi TaxID=6035 RepID=Q8SWK3_ENCCU|nr:uncharacterized protein ECU01_0955 [Encephalitozoon cuniculi GB-M1]AGE96121.1 hypothetical protein ECU01_0955 [Encephalitozoon cuniculi]KMV66749.1 hypothetical protein M970_010790 [Encephalitozoon cuniculi EcunIII-L]UYI28465.1 hypothetical protein J0A71_11g23780 [Encephalitozoon cuniculi]CAD24966.1 similarity to HYPOTHETICAL PROTEIN Y586_METJA [Encephalitozoon cuniculi GB-M1]
MRDNKPIILTRKKPEEQSKARDGVPEDTGLRIVSKRVGDAIANARAQKGMSRKDLAQKMKKNVSIIDSWERGEAVYNEKIAKEFESILEVKTDWK